MASSQGHAVPPHRMALGFALVAILVMLWSLDFPHQPISAFVGAHFPWPTIKTWKWPALLVERTLIEAILCLPAAFLLASYVRRYSVHVAVVLAVIFCLKVGTPLSASVARSYQWWFVIYMAVVHVALLVGGTAVLKPRD
jgi:hypothetical protein